MLLLPKLCTLTRTKPCPRSHPPSHPPHRDKRVVREPDSEADIWWGAGSPNYEMDERTFVLNRERAVDYLNTLDRLYGGCCGVLGGLGGLGGQGLGWWSCGGGGLGDGDWRGARVGARQSDAHGHIRLRAPASEPRACAPLCAISLCPVPPPSH